MPQQAREGGRVACVVEGSVTSVVQEWEEDIYVDCYGSQEEQAAEECAKDEYQAAKTVHYECMSLDAANEMAIYEFSSALEDFDSEMDTDAMAEALELLGGSPAKEEIEECAEVLEDEAGHTCSVNMDADGCLRFKAEFEGGFNGHGNQLCKIDIRVRIFGSS